MAARGSEESRRRADAPGRARAWLVTRVIDMRETRLTESDLETVWSPLADAISAVEVERTDAATTSLNAPCSTSSFQGVFTHPTPATREGILLVRTKPVMPPTMHRVPMT